MKISYGTEIVDLPNVSDDLKVKDVKEMILQHFDIAFASIKLIAYGRLLKDEDSIKELKHSVNTKLTMLATTAAGVDSMKPPEVMPRVRNDLDAIEDNSKFNAVNINNKRITPLTFGFMKIETLKLHDQHIAEQILHDLANDPGILAVMNKHKWKVGCLCEMYPEGYVGVSDVCIMGLNENRGSRILLRLRTDDLQGFRKILSIRKVLYHELAHNVHSDHGTNFYQLMRQIEKEVNELDWRRSGGQSLDPSFHSNSTTHHTYHGINGQESTPRPHFEVPTGGVRLGASSTDAAAAFQLHRILPARMLAGSAALLRLSEEEKEIEDGCACHRRGTTPPIPPSSPATDMEVEGVGEERGRADAVAMECEICGGNFPTTSDTSNTTTGPTTTTNGYGTAENTTRPLEPRDPADPHITADKLPSAVHEDTPEEDPRQQPVRWDLRSTFERIDDILANAVAATVTEDSSSDNRHWDSMTAIRSTSVALVTLGLTGRTNPGPRITDSNNRSDDTISTDQGVVEVATGELSVLLSGLKLLLTILGNAKNIPDPKYRSVNTNGNTFKKYVTTALPHMVLSADVLGSLVVLGPIPAAVSFLRACGFKDNVATTTGSSAGGSTGSQDHHLVLGARYDVALLYIGCSLLEVLIEETQRFYIEINPIK